MPNWTWSTPYKNVSFTVNVSSVTATSVRVLVTRDSNGATVLDQTFAYSGGAFSENDISEWKTAGKAAIAQFI